MQHDETPPTAPDRKISDVAASTKLGLTPEVASYEQCRTALTLIGESYGIKSIILQPHTMEACKIPVSRGPNDGKANLDNGILGGLLMSQLEPSQYELTDTGLSLKRSDLARAINAIAKDNPVMLARFSELPLATSTTAVSKRG